MMVVMEIVLLIQDPGAANNIWNCSNGVYEWQTGIERWDNIIMQNMITTLL